MKFNKLFIILAITLLVVASAIRIRRSETDTEAERKKKREGEEVKVEKCKLGENKTYQKKAFTEAEWTGSDENAKKDWEDCSPEKFKDLTLITPEKKKKI
jgi:hypothetical protein